MPGFTLIRVSSQQSLWVREVQVLTKWKNKSPVQSWLSSLMGEVALEESGSASTAVDLLFCEPMGTLYFQHPGQYSLLVAPWHVQSACSHFHQAKNLFL